MGKSYAFYALTQQQPAHCSSCTCRSAAPDRRRATTIDYRSSTIHGRPLPASWLAIASPSSLSSHETWVNPGISSLNKCLSESAQRQKAIGQIYFTMTGRPEAVQPGLEIGKFQPWYREGIFECTSCQNGSFRREDGRNFLKKWSQNVSNGTNFVF
jgi:hypothetical protein